MIFISKRTLAATLGALTLGAGLAASASPAAAGGGGFHHHGGWRGPALGVGLGLAVGGVLAASRYQGGYYSSCHFERRPVFNRFGDVVGYRQIRVC